MNVADKEQSDSLPFDLTGWKPVADEVRKHLKAMNGRNEELTDIPEAA